MVAEQQQLSSRQATEAELEKTETRLVDLKGAREEGESTKTTAENLSRKIQLLEDELDAAEKNVKETMEK